MVNYWKMFSTCYRQLHACIRLQSSGYSGLLFVLAPVSQSRRIQPCYKQLCVGCCLPIVLATSNYSNFKCFPTALMMEYSFHTWSISLARCKMPPWHSFGGVGQQILRLWISSWWGYAFHWFGEVISQMMHNMLYIFQIRKISWMKFHWVLG